MKNKIKTRKTYLCILVAVFMLSAAALATASARTEEATVLPDQAVLEDSPLLTDERTVPFEAQDESAPVDDNTNLTVNQDENLTILNEDSSLIATLDDSSNQEPNLIANEDQAKPDYTAMIVIIAAIVVTVVAATILTVTKLRKNHRS